MAIAPIWKDYFVNLESSVSMPFRIRIQDDVIYTGKAYARPGQATIMARINDVCADYLRNELPDLGQGQVSFTSLPFPVTFFVDILRSTAPGAEPEWEDIEEVAFVNDWSYDPSHDVTTMGFSAPINNRIDANQLLLFSVYNVQSLTATLTFKDGTKSYEMIMGATGSGTAVLDLSSWRDLASVAIKGQTFEVVSDCKEWVVYYVNAFGGWDSLLIEGNVQERDDLTRHTIQTEYDNRQTRNRGERNFVNEIEKVYTLNTSWMNDDESSRMHHLLNSTDVYLYNINSGEILPVVLTGTTTDYKTYKGNGGKLVNYTFEAKVAHDRIRR